MMNVLWAIMICKLCCYCSVLLLATRKHMKPWVMQGRRQLLLSAMLGQPSARSLEIWGNVGKNRVNGAKTLALQDSRRVHNVSAGVLTYSFFIIIIGLQLYVAESDWWLRYIFILGCFLLEGQLSGPGPKDAFSTRTQPSKNWR